jgi:hypothetical protein
MYFITLHDLIAPVDPAAVAALLAHDVVFHSPVADYQGRADVSHMLAAVGRCLRFSEPSDHMTGARSTAISFVTAVKERRADGVLIVRCTDDSVVCELTLLLRPLAVLRLAIAAMRDELEVQPLPSLL